MKSICTEPVQDVDKEKSHIMASSLRNSLVVRKILENFSDPELLRLSFVNKLWNYEARSVIRERCGMIARFDRNGLCHNIQAFAASLRQMKIVPFCGIRMVLSDKDESCKCKTSGLLPIHDVIFDPLPFKTMWVQVTGKRLDNQDCRGFLLAQKILQDASGFLEQLTIRFPFAAEMIMKASVQVCNFPKLLILKLEGMFRCFVAHEDYMKYVRGLISRAANLKELHSDGSIRELLDLVEGRSLVPVCSTTVNAPFLQISDHVIKSALRLERIKLVCPRGRPFDFDRFNRTAPMLLQASCSTTLCDLTLDAVLAIPFMCYGIRLENVRKLTMRINYYTLELEQHRILRFLKGFDFTRIFPSLSRVDITTQGGRDPLPLGLKTFIRDAYLSEPMPDRAVNIKELHSQDRLLGSQSSEYFAQMLPNTQRLYVEGGCAGNVFMLGSICENWLNLKELHIRSKFLEDTTNLDSVFCGIFFDELVQLMQKDEEYLKRVNIVPVKPSITCLRSAWKKTE